MEARRGARVATTFLVGIDGLDPSPRVRRGDISTTGVYFETSRDVGGVGTVQWLHLVSADAARTVHVMAYVVRTLSLADASGQAVGGVAFEFMPESDDAIAALADFVRYALALRNPNAEPRIEPRLDARVGPGASAQSATVRSLSVRSMVLETSWAIQPGESVRVDIVAPGMTRRIRLEGRAVRVAPRGPRAGYAIEVEVQEESDRPIRKNSSATFQAVRPHATPLPPPPAATPPPDGDEDVTRVLDDLLSALILPPEDEARKNRCHHLSGQLSRIRLPTLFSLFEMDRMTGRLVVRRGAEDATVYVDEGRLVDVEPLASRAVGARAHRADHELGRWRLRVLRRAGRPPEQGRRRHHGAPPRLRAPRGRGPARFQALKTLGSSRPGVKFRRGHL